MTSPGTRSTARTSTAAAGCRTGASTSTNGWWMCMIPRRVAEELGQPLPLFIKWDDADMAGRGRGARHTRPSPCPAPPSGTWPGAKGRRHRLAGLFPPAQPACGLGTALGRPGQGADGAAKSHSATFKHLRCSGIFDRRHSEQGHRRLWPARNTSSILSRRCRRSVPCASGILTRWCCPSHWWLPRPRAHRLRTGRGAAGDRRTAGAGCCTSCGADPAHHQRPQLNVADPGRPLVPGWCNVDRRDRHHCRRTWRGVPPA